MCWRKDLICQGLPSCEGAHVRVLLGCQLGHTVYGRRSYGSPLCQNTAVCASCLCNTPHLPGAYAPHLLVSLMSQYALGVMHHRHHTRAPAHRQDGFDGASKASRTRLLTGQDPGRCVVFDIPALPCTGASRLGEVAPAGGLCNAWGAAARLGVRSCSVKDSPADRVLCHPWQRREFGSSAATESAGYPHFVKRTKTGLSVCCAIEPYFYDLVSSSSATLMLRLELLGTLLPNKRGWKAQHSWYVLVARARLYRFALYIQRGSGVCLHDISHTEHAMLSQKGTWNSLQGVSCMLMDGGGWPWHQRCHCAGSPHPEHPVSRSAGCR